jgi:hypothetical protein
MQVKYVNKCEMLKNAVRVGPSLVPFQYLLDSIFRFSLPTSGTIVVTVVTVSAL